MPTDLYLGTDSDNDGKNDTFTDMSKDEAYMKLLLGSAEELEIVGIIRPKETAVATAMSNCAVGYLSDLTDWYIEKINSSELVKYQQAHKETDVLSGLPFITPKDTEITDDQKGESFKTWVDALSIPKKVEVFKTITTTPDKATIDNAINATSTGI